MSEEGVGNEQTEEAGENGENSLEGVRVPPSGVAGERESLTQFLDWQRGTLEMKCAGLDPAQLRRAEVPPSGLTLLTLVRHMADVERGWFHNVLGGDDRPSYWGRTTDGDWAEFEVAGADADEAFRVWRTACARSREVVGAAASLDDLSPIEAHGRRVNIRYVLLHLIEEYARHNGHADLLRERIDGATGE